MSSVVASTQATAPRWSERLADFAPAAEPAAAAWLLETGLLTERLRACCRGQPGLVIVKESEAPLAGSDAALLGAAGNAAFVREIELTCDGRPWVFAQTLIPQATLARQRWLASLGRAALGERLAALSVLERGPLEFARLAAGDRLYHRALRERRDPPPGLWARRSWFAIDGDRLLVQEVFLPESHA
ncbi:MAG: chorismate--pyruvate lyase family protein [Steroidobacteraceae bacterium]